MAGRRILIASPYASWHYHTAIEITLAHALRARGAQVLQVGCDGLFPVCDVHRANLNPRPANACVECQWRVLDGFRRLVAPLAWLGRWSDPAERSEIARWSRALRDDELAHAHWRSYPIGAWALSSALYQFRRSSLEGADAEVFATLRGQLEGCALAAAAYERLYEDVRPDALLVLNGRFFAHRAALELALRRGIRVHAHERGGAKDTLAWRSGSLYMDLEPARRLWAARAHLPLRAEELELVRRTLSDRRVGRGMSWSVQYSPAPQQEAALRERLALDERPLVAVFTSSDDEQATFPDYRAGAFPRARDWLPATVELARRMSDHQFVIRMHPGLVSFGANEGVLRDAEELSARLPENCRLVRPTEEVSSYSLADLAAVGIVYYTTLGLEMAARGQQVVAVAKGWYAHAGFCRFVEDARDYERAVRAASARARAEPADLEVARGAHRFLYHYFGDLSLPFPLVREEPMHCGKPSWRRTSELLPGRDAVLDRLCAALLEDRDVYPHARADDATRTEQDERAYFSGLGARAAA